MEKHLICSICRDLFLSRVTLGCGRSFCRLCLHCNFKYEYSACPLCKQPQHNAPGGDAMETLIQQVAQPERHNANAYTKAERCNCVQCLDGNQEDLLSTEELSKNKVSPVQHMQLYLCMI